MTYDSLPQYRSHKVVRAAKIANCSVNPNRDQTEGSEYLLFLEDPDGTAPFVIGVSPDWVVRATPAQHPNNVIGGYFVVYDDGYTSWSPAKAFEKGYTRIGPDGGMTGGFPFPVTEEEIEAQEPAMQAGQGRTNLDALRATMGPEVAEAIEFTAALMRKHGRFSFGHTAYEGARQGSTTRTPTLPTAGRIVQYHDPDGVFGWVPMLVVAARDCEIDGYAFHPNAAGMRWCICIPQGDAPGHWRWPPRV